MKHIAIFIFHCCILFSLRSQNLVPNPGFEDYDECPSGWGAVDYNDEAFPSVLFWFLPSYGSSDYFNACAVDDIASVPWSEAFGYSPAHTCDGMAGIFTYTDGLNFREYVEAQLSEPMVAGTQYYVEFYITAAGIAEDLDLGIYNFVLATDEIGAYFSEEKLLLPIGYTAAIDETPQIQNAEGNFPTDTSLWYKVSGIYTALGGEQYITIGNFKDDAETDFAYVDDIDPDPALITSGYVFIDDVLVMEYTGAETTTPGEIIFCDGDSTDLTGPVNALSYLWSTGEETQTITVLEAGIYSVAAAFECDTLIHEFTITVLPTGQTSSYTEIHICTDEFPITLNGAAGFTSFEWNVGFFTSFIITDDPGLYWVQSTNMCSSQIDTFNVTSVDPADVNLFLGNDTLICSNEPWPVLLDASGLFDTYLWSTGETTPTITVTEDGTYSVDADNVCGTWHDDITIETSPVLVKPELGDKIVLCEEDGFTEVTFTAPEQEGTYLWMTGDTTQSLTVHEPNLVWLELENACGKVRDSVIVQLCQWLYAPNAFSPNGDGINDVFAFVAFPNVELVSFVIYNRWGQLLFTTNDITEGWDGTFEGEVMPMESYVYIVHYDQFGFTEKKQGYFTRAMKLY